MTFTETFASVNSDFNTLENVLEKCEIFVEACYNEYEKNIKEAELKVIKENGTDEDYQYLEAEATEGLVGRIAEAISKMIDSVVKFIQSIYEKIAGKINDIQVKNAIKKAEKLANSNASLKEKKISIKDPKEELGLIDKTNADVDKLTAKLRSNPASVSSEDISDVKESYKKKKVAIAVTATVISVAGAIALYKTLIEKPSNSNCKNDTSSLESFKKFADKAKDNGSETMNKLYALAAVKSTIVKDKWKSLSSSIGSSFSNISSAISGSKNVTKESTDDIVTEKDAITAAQKAQKAINKDYTPKDDSKKVSLGSEVVNGIKGAAGSVKDATGNAVNAVKDAVTPAPTNAAQKAQKAANKVYTASAEDEPLTDEDKVTIENEEELNSLLDEIIESVDSDKNDSPEDIDIKTLNSKDDESDDDDKDNKDNDKKKDDDKEDKDDKKEDDDEEELKEESFNPDDYLDDLLNEITEASNINENTEEDLTSYANNLINEMLSSIN